MLHFHPTWGLTNIVSVVPVVFSFPHWKCLPFYLSTILCILLLLFPKKNILMVKLRKLDILKLVPVEHHSWDEF